MNPPRHDDQFGWKTWSYLLLFCENKKANIFLMELYKGIPTQSVSHSRVATSIPPENIGSHSMFQFFFKCWKLKVLKSHFENVIDICQEYPSNMCINSYPLWKCPIIACDSYFYGDTSNPSPHHHLCAQYEKKLKIKNNFTISCDPLFLIRHLKLCTIVLRLWNSKWQLAWFSVANWTTQFQVQSNNHSRLWSWTCPQ